MPALPLPLPLPLPITPTPPDDDEEDTCICIDPVNDEGTGMIIVSAVGLTAFTSEAFSPTPLTLPKASSFG